MRWLGQVAIVLLLTLSGTVLQAGELIDRIVATVGKRAILQSELEERVRFEAFSAGSKLESIGNADVNAALDHIIDQELIVADVGNPAAFSPSEESVRQRVAEIRAQLPEASTNEGWQQILNQYGLTENILSDHIRKQLETMRMVNQKLRPNVRVDQTDIEAAYQQEFLPKLRQAGAKEVPLSEISARIRQILVERRIGELLESWLQTLRQERDVHIQLTVPGEAASIPIDSKKSPKVIPPSSR